MDEEMVKAKLKEIIGNAAELDPNTIQDDDDVRDDLKLDSLTLLEIMVDVDLAFQLELPDERYVPVRTVSAAAALVLERRKELDANRTPPA